MRIDAEFLVLPPRGNKALKYMNILAMNNASKVSFDYRGDKEVLFVWGVGGAQQAKVAQKHMESGRPVICLDIGYFQNMACPKFKDGVRITINAPHPRPEYFFLAEKGDRLQKLGIVMDKVYDPRGKIIVCGMGPKSRQQYGFNRLEWETYKVHELRRQYPNNQIAFRPKPYRNGRAIETMPGVLNLGNKDDMKDLLRGAAGLAVFHSNAAIEALALGVPVSAETGIASELVGNKLEINNPISHKERKAFLETVAWFHWGEKEMHLLLGHIARNLSRIKEAQREKTPLSVWETHSERPHKCRHGKTPPSSAET